MPKIDDSLEPGPNEVWLPFTAWEEVPHNMWGDYACRGTWRQIAATFTGNAKLYGEWMLKVAEQWPASCRHNLTKPGDKRAWMGHAAVAMAIGCPEDIVREAWGDLTDEQRERANNKASEAITHWKGKHA